VLLLERVHPHQQQRWHWRRKAEGWPARLAPGLSLGRVRDGAGKCLLIARAFARESELLASSTSSLFGEHKIVPKPSGTQRWVKSPVTAKISVLHLDPPELLL